MTDHQTQVFDQKSAGRKRSTKGVRSMEKVGATPMKQIHAKVNGVDYDTVVESRLLLVHFIRENLRLKGTHIGCDTSNCGACTLILNGKSVKSCSMFAFQADGAEILTIEGLASKDGTLHPIQQAFWDNHGLQCGFCTPGFIMQAYWFLKENPNPTEDQVRIGISGNLCRCTGYQNIVKAILAAAGQMHDGEKKNKGK